MKFICDAPGGKSWFRIETAAEAAAESLAMHHAVEKFFLAEEDKAARKYRPSETGFIEQEIGLKAHLQRSMPMFLTLRDAEGRPLATAMLPPNGRDSVTFRPIIVGPGNSGPLSRPSRRHRGARPPAADHPRSGPLLPLCAGLTSDPDDLVILVDGRRRHRTRGRSRKPAGSALPQRRIHGADNVVFDHLAAHQPAQLAARQFGEARRILRSPGLNDPARR